MAATDSGAARKLHYFPIEAALFALIFWADGAGFIPISKTPFLFLVAWISLRLRGSGWRAAGLNFDRRWLSLLGIGLAAGAAFWAFELFVENPLLYWLTGRYPDLDVFADLVGNIRLLAILIALNLILAAFGEEMVWRGYVLPRVAEILGDSRAAPAAFRGGRNRRPCRPCVRARTERSSTSSVPSGAESDHGSCSAGCAGTASAAQRSAGLRSSPSA